MMYSVTLVHRDETSDIMNRLNRDEYLAMAAKKCPKNILFRDLMMTFCHLKDHKQDEPVWTGLTAAVTLHSCVERKQAVNVFIRKGMMLTKEELKMSHKSMMTG